MSIKKLAIFVEGHTESYFIKNLLESYFEYNTVAIEINNFYGGKTCSRTIQFVSSTPVTTDTQIEVIIYNSCNDTKVTSDLCEQYESLKNAGYTQFICIRDLYPLVYSKKSQLEASVNRHMAKNGILSSDVEYIIATMEVETWFIAETNHYLAMDNTLTIDTIKNNGVLDFNSSLDYEKDILEPAKKLDEIYRIVSLRYTKNQEELKAIVENFDFTNLYINVRNDIPSLNQLYKTLDNFIV